jgi:GT2 family glycosyltransferase
VQSFPTVINQVLACEFFRRIFPRWSIWGLAPLYASEPSQAEAVSGACILVKKEAFDRVGGFGDYYFMYGEDLDLCFKLRQAGYRVYHIPETTIVHFGGGSTNNSSFSNVMMRESVYRFLQHNRGNFSAASYRMAMAAASVVRVLLILPLLAVSGRAGNRLRLGSLRKWLAIFRWSLGLQPLTPAHS